MTKTATRHHEAFRARQKVIKLKGIVHIPVRVAYSDIGLEKANPSSCFMAFPLGLIYITMSFLT